MQHHPIRVLVACCFFASVVLAATTGARATGRDDDAGAAQAVIDAIRANRSRLDTWRGKVSRVLTRTEHPDEAAEVDVQPQPVWEQTIDFSWSEEHDALSSVLAISRNGNHLDDPPAKRHAQMRIGTTYYSIDRLSEKPDQRQRITIRENGPASQISSPYFDPLQEYLAPNDTDVLTILERVATPNPAAQYKQSVERKGDCLIVRLSHGDSYNQYMFAMSSGGNLIEYQARTEGMGKVPLVRTIRIQYQRFSGGVFLPTLIVNEFSRPQGGQRVVTTEETRFVDSEPNVELLASAFSLVALGANAGDLVVDERTGIRYAYRLGGEAWEPRVNQALLRKGQE